MLPAARAMRARADVVHKPWGSRNLLPWSNVAVTGEPVGEIWFEAANAGKAPETALLLKLLFTEQRLSVQVHPDDALARKQGLPNGKTEAWYVLSARPGGQVAVGLRRDLSKAELRRAVVDGSLAGLVQWRAVAAGDLIFVPAGTIHAIGPGLVIAEIQQRSDTTYRMYDFGRGRDLHLEEALTAADPGPLMPQAPERRFSDERTILVAVPSFVLERVSLPAHSVHLLNGGEETWIMAIAGTLKLAGSALDVGDAGFVSNSSAELVAGPAGATALVAYPGPDPDPGLIEATGSRRKSS